VKRIGVDLTLAAGLRPARPATVELQSTLDWVTAVGLDGVLVRMLHELSPDLDMGLLREIRAHADALGLYLEIGIGKVNPFMTCELPWVRKLGDGSYLAGMQRMVAACAEIGVHELWTATGGYKPALPSPFSIDRFRTDAPWSDQLGATERFLRELSPCLRDHGARLNLETHEEITSFEVARLVEAVGEDVLGVCLDPANLVVGGEDPLAGTRRVARYVHMTHLRDVALCFDGGAISRFLAPCGEGVIDWAALLGVLRLAGCDANLTIEGAWPHRVEMTIHPDDPAWRAAYPDVTVAELERTRLLTQTYERRVRADGAPGLRALREPCASNRRTFVARSAEHLRTRFHAQSHVPDPPIRSRHP
jgi:sugar phosphate isomerase/epimerase